MWSKHFRACRATRKPMIKAIKFASVPVRDQDRALEFYTQALGLKVVTDQPFNDRQRWIELAIPRAETKLVLFTPHGQEDRGRRIGAPPPSSRTPTATSSCSRRSDVHAGPSERVLRGGVYWRRQMTTGPGPSAAIVDVVG
jgi:catechol 2,3-dioxygenase-like lactoylglutathione lyase family enzyme